MLMQNKMNKEPASKQGTRSQFVLADYSWDGSCPVLVFAQWYSIRENRLSLCCGGGVSVVDGSLFRARSRVHFLLSVLGPMWLVPVQVLWVLLQFLGVHMNISSVASGRHCVLAATHNLSLNLSSSLSWRILSLEGWGLRKPSHLELCAPQSLSAHRQL